MYVIAKDVLGLFWLTKWWTLNVLVMNFKYLHCAESADEQIHSLSSTTKFNIFQWAIHLLLVCNIPLLALQSINKFLVKDEKKVILKNSYCDYTMFMDTDDIVNEKTKKVIAKARMEVLFIEILAIISDMAKILVKFENAIKATNDKSIAKTVRQMMVTSPDSIIEDIPRKVDAALKEKTKNM
ncbi:hypothetical protein RFI_28395 [Reticulomyxa filosa]|uniref:Uncharacterized protein n=1 Tax=Reticulomyxa filosa TaxID=46433 RepID=X6M4T6_RETFI|nr:hypothetical protein RFI_28395 [Reticulomyxa filosa]|eukprot:ETO08993.1 hypothetical protein RFI_28395 [Reticulomyxa filosa]